MKHLVDRDLVAAELAAGHLVAIPTDTVYGVAARLDCPDAVRALFRAKGRPETVALPVFVSSLDEATTYGARVNERAVRLTAVFWPGPLTVVVDASTKLAQAIGATDSVGLRCPHDDDVAALVARSGPLVVTSANRHGEPPCTTADDVLAVFAEQGLVTAVFDGGVREGAVSSVVDTRGSELVILRDGALSATRLRSVLED